MSASKSQLLFPNEFGGYDPKRQEYVINLKPGVTTPKPWVNILTNEHFGTIISESGSSFTWYQNSYQYRITERYSDPVSDTSSESIFIRDESSGQIWSPTPLPIRGESSYTIRHGLGYSIFENNANQLDQQLTIFVSRHKSIKFFSLSLTNRSPLPRKLTLSYFADWTLGDFRHKTSKFLNVRVSKTHAAVLAQNAFDPNFPDVVAFAGVTGGRTALSTSRKMYFGMENSSAAPGMLVKTSTVQTGVTGENCAVVQSVIELKPGEQKQVCFFLGACHQSDLSATIRTARKKDIVEQELSQVKNFWTGISASLQISTPSASLDTLINSQLLYQVTSSRLWARTGFYQPGGAYGFRDQLQDILSLLWTNPHLVADYLLFTASRQFPEGDVQNWWHPPHGRGIRTPTSDQHLWLPYAVSLYSEMTGDFDILKKEVAFLEAGETSHDEYFLPHLSEKTVSIYEHCVAAIELSLSRFGPHGLPLILKGDWNDGLNRVGEKGVGESVWVAIFLSECLVRFSELSLIHQDEERGRRYRQIASQIIKNVEAHCWDGRWYIRAFYDDGSVLGSHVNHESKIDSLPQTWGTFTGLLDRERSEISIMSVLSRLVDQEKRIIKLLDPPFTAHGNNPGYIKDYPVGIRENGAQYNHAALWVVKAVASLGRGNLAMDLLNLINPFERSSGPNAASTYGVEPYVVASDIYSSVGHVSEGGWTWYTGSAGLFYRLVVEDILGIVIRNHTLHIDPCIPQSWDRYSVKIKFKQSTYHIHILNVNKSTGGISTITVDGKTHPEQDILLVSDGKTHEILAEL